MRLSSFALALAFSLPTVAFAAKCNPESLSGDWQRVAKDGTTMKAVWNFNRDGTVGCKGQRCAGIMGKPTTYGTHRRNITVLFQKSGRMQGKCAIKNGQLHIGGGAKQGGMSFQQQ